MYVLYDISCWDIANRAVRAFIDFEFVTDLVEIGMGGGLDRSVRKKTESRFLRLGLSQSKDRGLKSGSSKDKIVFSFDRANRFFYIEECAKILASVP